MVHLGHYSAYLLYTVKPREFGPGPKNLAVLRGVRISEGFLTRKCLAGRPKKVAVITR